MSAPTEDVDWAEADRGLIRDLGLTVLGLASYFVALVALDDGFAGLEGRAGWLAVAGCLALVGIAVVAQLAVPALRSRAARARRVQYALRRHADPGPGARTQADVGARRLARIGWAPWCLPFPVAALLAAGRWDRPPVAVPAALVLLGLTGAWFVVVRRQVRYARRWVADPPGPRREVPAPNALELWTGGRRLLALWLALTVVAAATGLLVAVLA